MDNRYVVLHRAVSELSARCDGAVSQDGQGFNGHDNKFGNRVAAMPLETWTNVIAAEVARILPTYQGQLKAYGVDYSELKKVIDTFKDEPDKRTEARDMARQAEYAKKHAPYITITDNGTVVRVWNSYPVKDDLKPNGFLFGRKGTKTWDSDLNGIAAATILRLDIALDTEQRLLLESFPAEEMPVSEFTHIDICQDHPEHLQLKTEFFGQVPVNVTRALPGRKWDGYRKVDHITPHIGLITLAEEYKLTISDMALEMIESHRAEQEAEIAVKREAMADSYATDTNVAVPLADNLRPFQRAGVAYGINHMSPGKGVMIGDEMGLGKTRQAIAILEANKAYPALVVCPPKLTINWKREIQALLPNLRVSALSGKGTGCFLDEADIYVVGYSVLDTYVDILPEIAGLVLDESHYAKNEKAGRTMAAMTITGHGYIEEKVNGRKVRHPLPGKMTGNSVIIELTGTSILNRPIELVPQLIILGWLDDTSWTMDEGTVKWFKYRFCDPQRGYGGHITFNGQSNLLDLHEWLRAHCYVRREKKDVLTELPPKTRAPLFIELDPASRALYEQLADEGAEKAAQSSAEALVYMNALRKAVGKAKIATAIEWADDFLDSTDQSLIIFAHHREVQNGIIEGLKAKGYDVLQILGGQSVNATEEAKRAFQAKEARVIVLSLMGAKEGHTLTAASNVLMVEQGWNPGTQDQAEDRAHRMGQDEPVTIWYLLPTDTIDDDLYAIVEGKRKVVRVVNSGITAEMDEETVFTELLDKTLARHGGGKRTYGKVNAPTEESQYRGCDDCGKVTDCRLDPDLGWICDECLLISGDIPDDDERRMEGAHE